jgi:hypothetical protein
VKTETTSQFDGAVVQDGAPLPSVYWLGFALILIAGVVAAIWLPYKTYPLNFGNYGVAPLIVSRFSGTQSIRLNGGWHSLSGNVLGSEIYGQISLQRGEIENAPGGVKLRLVVKNATASFIRQVIVGSFVPADLPHNSSRLPVHSIGLIDCNIPPYSEGAATVSFGRGTDTTHLHILAVVGQER